MKAINLLTYLLLTCFLILNTACTKYEKNSLNLPALSHCNNMYTYGDASYDKQLEQGSFPVKRGMIPAGQVPQEFPQKFLEPDGSYGGGRVYCSIKDAEKAILEAKNNGLLPQGEEWGIYQLEGNWETYAYELHPNDYRLRNSTVVIKRVK